MSELSTSFNCQDCDEKKRKERNCYNRDGVVEVCKLKEDWSSEDPRPVLKVQGAKFFACPMSVITESTWSILDLVNNTTDGDCNILNLPFPGSYLEQPKWYRDAVNIVRSARAEHRRRQAQKRANNG